MVSSFRTQSDGLGCANDEARSLKLMNVKAGTTIGVFDDPRSGNGDDFAIVQVFRDSPRLVVPTFERSTSNEYYAARYFHRNGLNGKISSARLRVR